MHKAELFTCFTLPSHVVELFVVHVCLNVQDPPSCLPFPALAALLLRSRSVSVPCSSVSCNSDSSSRLLLEALRMIRSRQRQGRGDPQPASAAIMEGVWTGRWDPTKNGGVDNDGVDETGHARSRSGRGDNPRCAVCLEEVGGGGAAAAAGDNEETVAERAECTLQGRVGEGVVGPVITIADDWTAAIGSEETVHAGAENVHAKGSFAYLPCGHRFHTSW